MKKKIIAIIAVLLVVVMAFTLVACKKKTTQTDEQSAAPTQNTPSAEESGSGASVASVKYAKPVPTSYTAEEAWAVIEPLFRTESFWNYTTQGDSDVTLEEVKEDFTEDVFDEISEILFKTGITLDDGRAIVASLQAMWNAVGPDLARLREGEVTGRQFLTGVTKDQIKAMQAGVRSLFGALDANKLLAYYETLFAMQNYRVDRDEGAYLGNETVTRATMDSLFSPLGITEYDAWTRVRGEVENDAMVTSINLYLRACKRFFSYDPDKFADAILTVISMTQEDDLDTAKLTSVVHTAGELLQAGSMTGTEAETFRKGIQPVLRANPDFFNDFDELKYYVDPLGIFRTIVNELDIDEAFEAISFPEVFSHPEWQKAVGEVLAGVTEDEVKAFMKLYDYDFDIERAFDRLSYREDARLINLVGKLMTSFSNYITDSNFYEVAFGDVLDHISREYFRYSTSDVYDREIIRMVGALASRMTETKLSELFMNYDEYEKSTASDEKEKLGYFVASIVDFVAPEYGKLSAATIENIDHLSYWFGGSIKDFCNRMMSLVGSDYKSLSKETLVAIADAVYEMGYGRIEEDTARYSFNVSKYYSSEFESNAQHVFFVSIDPTTATQESVIKAFDLAGITIIDLNQSYYAGKALSEFDFTYSFSTFDDGYPCIVIKIGEEELRFENDVNVAAKYALKLMNNNAYFYRFSLNQEQGSVLTSLKNTSISVTVCNRETDEYGVAYNLSKAYLRDLVVDTSTTGLKAGSYVLETPWGDVKVPFLYRVYNPEVPEAVGISVSSGGDPIAMGSAEEVLRQNSYVTVYYDNGNNGRVTDYTIEGFDTSTAGDKTCTVRYGTFTEKCPYYVYDPEHLIIKYVSSSWNGGSHRLPIGTTEEALRSLLRVYVVYDSGARVDIPSDAYTIEGFDSSKEIENGVFKIRYEGKTDSWWYSIYDPDQVLMGSSSYSSAPAYPANGSDKMISITGNYAYFSYTPSTTGTYVFYTNSSYDTYGELRDSSGNFMTNDDDGGNSNNFRISYSLTAGNTYYIGVKLYSSGSAMVNLYINRD